MTIHYSLTFILLAAEMATFCIIVSPLPFPVRKKMFTFLRENFIVAKIAYGLKISFIFVGILFLDAVQRMLRAQQEFTHAKKVQGVPEARAEASLASRKFYSERNAYLTGFCLFLSLVLTRVFSIISDLIEVQEAYANLKKNTANQSRSNLASEDQVKVIEELQAKLKNTEREYDVVKKQAKQNADEYDRLATRYNEAVGNKSNKKGD